MLDWQDERFPEDVLKKSAQKTKYNTPWDMLNRPDNLPEDAFLDANYEGDDLTKDLLEKKVDKLSVFSKTLQKIEDLFRNYKDKKIGESEKSRIISGDGPSQRALAEGLAYYAGLYQEKGPDPSSYIKLLKRNGVPDWLNPFSESSLDHYQYHPQGLLVADVDYLLQEIEKDWNRTEKIKQDVDLKKEENLDLKKTVIPIIKGWPSLLVAETQRENTQNSISNGWRSNARICWALTLIEADKDPLRKSLSNIKKEVHADNLWLISMDTYKNFPDKIYGFTKENLRQAIENIGFGFGLKMLDPDFDNQDNI